VCPSTRLKRNNRHVPAVSFVVSSQATYAWRLINTARLASSSESHCTTLPLHEPRRRLHRPSITIITARCHSTSLHPSQFAGAWTCKGACTAYLVVAKGVLGNLFLTAFLVFAKARSRRCMYARIRVGHRSLFLSQRLAFQRAMRGPFVHCRYENLPP
jgi:hypothetical protein